MTTELSYSEEHHEELRRDQAQLMLNQVINEYGIELTFRALASWLSHEADQKPDWDGDFYSGKADVMWQIVDEIKERTE